MTEWFVRSGVPLIVLFAALALLRYWWSLAQAAARRKADLTETEARRARRAERQRLAGALTYLRVGTPIAVLQWNRRDTVFGLYLGIKRGGDTMPMITVKLADDRELDMTPFWWRRASVLELVAHAASHNLHKIP